MKHRIRAAALITRDDAVLLVQHVHPDTGEEWWVPPGGGIEMEDASLFECARREVFEETGLQVELKEVVYLREFIDHENQNRNLEIFVEAESFSGDLTIANVQGSGPDEHFIRDVRWVRREEMDDMVIYPEILKNEFWNDLAEGFPKTKFLGVQIG